MSCGAVVQIDGGSMIFEGGNLDFYYSNRQIKNVNRSEFMMLVYL